MFPMEEMWVQFLVGELTSLSTWLGNRIPHAKQYSEILFLKKRGRESERNSPKASRIGSEEMKSSLGLSQEEGEFHRSSEFLFSEELYFGLFQRINQLS